MNIYYYSKIGLTDEKKKKFQDAYKKLQKMNKKLKKQNRTSLRKSSSNKKCRTTEIFTNEKGYVKSIAIPYGTYLVRETTTPHNYKPVDDFIVRITENKPTENLPFVTVKVKFWKLW